MKVYEGNSPYIFISYSHHDAIIRPILSRLIFNRVRIWFDVDNHAGDNWNENISNHLLNAKYFLLFVSNNFVNSNNCMEELDLAIKNNKIIIPFQIEDLTEENDNLIKDKIGSLHFGDAKETDLTKNTRFILDELKEKYSDAFDILDKMFFENDEKRFYLDVIKENEYEGKADRRLLIYSINKSDNKTVTLFDIDTPTGVDIRPLILNLKQDSNEYFDEDNNASVFFDTKIDFLFDEPFINEEVTILINFALVRPLSKDTKVRVLDVKILSPISGKYCVNKDFVELKEEFQENGKKVLEFLDKKLLIRTKDDLGASNCLEQEDKKTELISIKQILSSTRLGENIFIIPNYQRGYAWNFKSEFNDLWKDILRLFYSGTKNHYTGMLSLEEMNNDDKEKEGLEENTNAFYVVDGQQRLTSLIIILKALFEYIYRLSGEDLASNYLYLDDGRYRFLYSRDNDDSESREYFIYRIYEGRNDLTCSNMYLRNIDEAKRFIDEALLAFDIDETKKLLELVLECLIFNVYFAGEFDVRVTFETMNNRGKHLSNLELLKNRLMYLSSFLNDRTRERALINDINTAWKNIYRNICFEDYMLGDDEYLKAHWIVYDNLDKAKGDSYIKKILEKRFAIDTGDFYELIQKRDYQKAYRYLSTYVKSLGRMSAYWRLVNNPYAPNSVNASDEEKRYLDKLNRIIDRPNLRATLMVIAEANDIRTEDKLCLYKTLERSIFINYLLGSVSNDCSPLSTIAGRFMKAEPGRRINIFNELMAQCKTSFLDNTDARIFANIHELGYRFEKDNKNFYKWNGIRYFLYEYEQNTNFGSDKVVHWKNIKDNSIEHILPQTPSRIYWQIVLEGFDEEGINKLTNSIGNLLLLSSEENSQLQNYSYPKKRGENLSDRDIDRRYAYIYGTNAAREVATRYDYWTAHAISDREYLLFEYMYRTWIHKDGSRITLEQFLNALLDNHLALPDYPEIDDDTKNRLDMLDLSDETHKTVNTLARYLDEKKKDMAKYFISKDYSVEFKPRISFKDNIFKIKVKDNSDVEAGIKLLNKDYKFQYYDSINIMYVLYRESGSGFILFNDWDNIPEGVKYFITTFSRYLQLSLARDNPAINPSEEE